MCDANSFSNAISGLSDTVSNFFGSGAAGEASAAGDAASAATDFSFGGSAGGGTFPPADVAAGAAPSIADIAGTSAGSAGGGFDFSAFGGTGSAPSSAPGGGTFPPAPASGAPSSFAGGPGGISGIMTSPAASATPAASIGGTSAAAAAPPGDFSVGGTIGDLKTLDPKTIGTGVSGGAAAPSGDPFAGIQAPTGPATGTGGPAAGGHTNSIMDAIRQPNADNILNAVGNNSGALLGGAVLGSQLLADKSSAGGQLQAVPTTPALSHTAESLSAAAVPLIAGPVTGQLPAGLDSAIHEAAAAQKAHIRSQYAGMGLAGSTMEQQALNQVDMAAEQQRADQIQKLVQTGLSETQLSAQIYQQLQTAQLAGDKELSQALANFAAAVGGAGVPRQQAA